jgi:hypothetical protein
MWPEEKLHVHNVEASFIVRISTLGTITIPLFGRHPICQYFSTSIIACPLIIF